MVGAPRQGVSPAFRWAKKFLSDPSLSLLTLASVLGELNV